PLAGSASADTSGTPRPSRPPGLAEGGNFAALCHDGGGKTSLIPPPLAPPPAFQTTSLERAPFFTLMRVPPQAPTCGLEAGKSRGERPSFSPSLDPLSPDAQQTVMPSIAAAWNAWSNCVVACAVHRASGAPQLIEIADGPRLSWVAVVIASRKPRSVLGAK